MARGRGRWRSDSWGIIQVPKDGLCHAVGALTAGYGMSTKAVQRRGKIQELFSLSFSVIVKAHFVDRCGRSTLDRTEQLRGTRAKLNIFTNSVHASYMYIYMHKTFRKKDNIPTKL